MVVLIIFPVILQTVINVNVNLIMLSIEGQGAVAYSGLLGLLWTSN